MLIGSKQIIMIFIVFFLIFSFAIGQVVWIYLDSKKRVTLFIRITLFSFNDN